MLDETGETIFVRDPVPVVPKFVSPTAPAVVFEHDEISIVAGGWSVSQVDLSKLPGLKIGVNDAAFFAPCDVTVSMDRKWTEFRWPLLKKLKRPAYIREAALRNVAHGEADLFWLAPYECDHLSTTFSDVPRILNGTQSGYCALNLAYQMRPKRLYLFGFDMRHGPLGEGHWYPPYPWTTRGGATTSGKYKVWAREIAHAAKQFRDAGTEVISGSPYSAIMSVAKTSRFLKSSTLQ